jgi:hypothetical protein
VALMSTPEIKIEWVDGKCPVQSEGEIDGCRYYFRARGEHWSITIAPKDVTGDYKEWPTTDEAINREFRYEEEWGDGPYAASWMPEDVAREMIAKGARQFVASKVKP